MSTPENLLAPEVAARLRITPAQARALARGGHISATKPGKQWLFKVEAVKEYEERNPSIEPVPTRRRRRRAA